MNISALKKNQYQQTSAYAKDNSREKFKNDLPMIECEC